MNVGIDGEAVQATVRPFRLLFVLALLVTLVSLLTPGEQVLAFKVWVASWLPFAAMLDAANVTQNSDKLVHATLFACMGFLAVRGWTQRNHLAWVLLGVLWLAPQTEWLQAYIPGRGASLADAVADVLGLAVGVACAWRVRGCCAAGTSAGRQTSSHDPELGGLGNRPHMTALRIRLVKSS